MRKLILGGILIFVVMATTMGFSQAPSLGTQTDTGFPARLHQFTRQQGVGGVRGMYIYRTQDNWDTQYNFNDVFVGNIQIHEPSFPAIGAPAGTRLDWEFEVVEHINGDWIASNAFNIFPVRSAQFGWGVEYHFRKDLPRGLYGIRARAYREIINIEEGTRERIRAQMFDDLGETVYIESIYEILYGDSVRFLGASSGGQNILRRGNIPSTVTIQVAPNGGAMDIGSLERDIEHHVEGFVLGPLVGEVQLNTWNMNIQVLRNGWAVPNSVIPVVSFGDIISLDLSGGLSYARYLVRFYHPSDPDVVGTFMIDNTTNRIYRAPDMSGAVVAMMVLGTLAAVAAAVFFAAPKIIIAKQEKRYAHLQNDRYMAGEGSKVDKSYKAQSANESLRAAMGRADTDVKKKTRATGFLDSIRASRARRELAREHGITMEQYKELEKKHKDLEKAKETSLSDFREAIEEKKVQEKVVKEYKANDGFDMLDSVAREASVTDHQVVQSVVQPNVAGEGSILSNLRAMAGEDEETKRVAVADSTFAEPLVDTPLEEVVKPNLEPLVDTPLEPESQPKQEVIKETPPPPVGILSRISKLTED
ncbi:MAG: hypothetical protein FWE31_03235 [Firmicutes bacterium]|nr:hypothetical protein [Bacillota bacterium]